MNRPEAIGVMRDREGMPREEAEAASTQDLIAAAEAPEGQPCADCGHLVVWDDDLGDWRHAVRPTGCFLARADKR